VWLHTKNDTHVDKVKFYNPKLVQMIINNMNNLKLWPAKLNNIRFNPKRYWKRAQAWKWYPTMEFHSHWQTFYFSMAFSTIKVFLATTLCSTWAILSIILNFSRMPCWASSFFYIGCNALSATHTSSLFLKQCLRNFIFVLWTRLTQFCSYTTTCNAFFWQLSFDSKNKETKGPFMVAVPKKGKKTPRFS
jgi:hypothetical protein